MTRTERNHCLKLLKQLCELYCVPIGNKQHDCYKGAGTIYFFKFVLQCLWLRVWPVSV